VAILCLISAVWGCRSIIEVIHCHDICCDIFGLCVNFFCFYSFAFALGLSTCIIPGVGSTTTIYLAYPGRRVHLRSPKASSTILHEAALQFKPRFPESIHR
jgi:hypothetical protein